MGLVDKLLAKRSVGDGEGLGGKREGVVGLGGKRMGGGVAVVVSGQVRLKL